MSLFPRRGLESKGNARLRGARLSFRGPLDRYIDACDREAVLRSPKNKSGDLYRAQPFPQASEAYLDGARPEAQYGRLSPDRFAPAIAGNPVSASMSGTAALGCRSGQREDSLYVVPSSLALAKRSSAPHCPEQKSTADKRKSADAESLTSARSRPADTHKNPDRGNGSNRSNTVAAPLRLPLNERPGLCAESHP